MLNRSHKTNRLGIKNNVMLVYSAIKQWIVGNNYINAVPYQEYIPPQNLSEALATEAYCSDNGLINNTHEDCFKYAILPTIIAYENDVRVIDIITVETLNLADLADAYARAFPITVSDIRYTFRPDDSVFYSCGDAFLFGACGGWAYYDISWDILIEKFISHVVGTFPRWCEFYYRTVEDIENPPIAPPDTCDDLPSDLEVPFPPRLVLLYNYYQTKTRLMRKITVDFWVRWDSIHPETGLYLSIEEWESLPLYTPNWGNLCCIYPRNELGQNMGGVDGLSLGLVDLDYLINRDDYETLLNAEHYCHPPFPDVPIAWDETGVEVKYDTIRSIDMSSSFCATDEMVDVLLNSPYEEGLIAKINDVNTDHGTFSKIGRIEGTLHRQSNSSYTGHEQYVGHCVNAFLTSYGNVPSNITLTLGGITYNAGVESQGTTVALDGQLEFTEQIERLTVHKWFAQDIIDLRQQLVDELVYQSGAGFTHPLVGTIGYALLHVETTADSIRFTYRPEGRVLNYDGRPEYLPPDAPYFMTPTYTNYVGNATEVSAEWAMWVERYDLPTYSDWKAMWSETSITDFFAGGYRSDVATDRHGFTHKVATVTTPNVNYYWNNEAPLFSYPHAISYQSFTPDANTLNANIGYVVPDYFALDDPDSDGHFIMDEEDLPDLPVYQYNPSLVITNSRLACLFIREGELHYAQHFRDGITNNLWSREQIPHSADYCYAYGDAFHLSNKIYWIGYCDLVEFSRFEWLYYVPDSPLLPYYYLNLLPDKEVLGVNVGYYCQVGTLNSDGTLYEWSDPTPVEFFETEDEGAAFIPPNPSSSVNASSFKINVQDDGFLIIAVPQAIGEATETNTPILYRSAGVLTDSVMPFIKISG